ncbi:MAG: response regulator [Thermoanaerobaculia bacterium]|nr:MAG: response regulator [Thermoanaerobaculia bacterium]
MRRVWVVEDNDPNFELVEFLLGEAGWDVVRARDAAEFAALLESVAPDLVLLDMNLPDAAGLELLADLRRRPAYERVPVLALTAHAMRGDRERFLAAGCDGYLSKPIDTAGFARAIDETLARRPR